MALILIVDDEEMDLERGILEAAGHHLLFASDGEAALRICQEEPVELVVTDLAMPDFNGLRFIRQLREAHLYLPLIAVSGWAVDQLDLAREYGADLALPKPLDGDALLSAVQTLLSRPARPDRVDPWHRERK
jgi:DNA-binding response OmpR family regulator